MEDQKQTTDLIFVKFNQGTMAYCREVFRDIGVVSCKPKFAPYAQEVGAKRELRKTHASPQVRLPLVSRKCLKNVPGIHYFH